MEPKDRLRIAIEKLKTVNSYTQDDIMRLLNYSSPGYLTHLLSGKKDISPKFLLKLERELFVRKQWIETGEGEMLINMSAIVSKMIDDLFPKWSAPGKRAFRVIIEILAHHECRLTGKSYLDCLNGIYHQIEQSEDGEVLLSGKVLPS